MNTNTGSFLKLLKLGKKFSHRTNERSYDSNTLRGLSDMFLMFGKDAKIEDIQLFILHEVIFNGGSEDVVKNINSIYEEDKSLSSVCNKLHLLNNNKYNPYSVDSIRAVLKCDPELSSFILTDLNAEARYSTYGKGIEKIENILLDIKDDLLKYISANSIDFLYVFAKQSVQDYYIDTYNNDDYYGENFFHGYD